MKQLKRISISVSYNDRDITADISDDLEDFSYTDKEHGAADDITLCFNDKKLRWQNDWFPDKGARLKVSFGYVGRMVPAGVFQVNKFRLTGPPDVAKIDGISAGITQAVRTKNNNTHENKTLKQIIQSIADAHNFTLQGDIADIHIKRETQNKETDLGFVKRLGEEYGYVVSFRDNIITFHSVFDLEDIEPIATLDKTDCSSYDFDNKITGTYKSGRIRHTNSNSKAHIQATAELGAQPTGQQQTSSVDVLEIHHRVENELQAQFKIKAALHKHNKRLSEVEIETEGNPYLCAGNNIILTGFGELSGTYHITESRHKDTKDGGYSTSFTAHKVNTPAAGTKRPKPKPLASPRPTYTPIGKYPYEYNQLTGKFTALNG